MAVSPGSTASLRTANQRRVIDVLRGDAIDGHADGVHTQADLARMTGLAPATISNIVRDLVASGLVETEPGSGRRGTTVRMALSAGLVTGVDFGHSHVAVALGDISGNVIDEQRQPLAATAPYQEGLALASDLLESLLKAAGTDQVRTVGLGLPAPITGDVVRSATILPGWVGVNAQEAAEAVFAAPVFIDNDANLGALAERRRGVSREHDTSIFVKVSSGVGSGLIIDGRIFHGSSGTAGEIGHLTLDEQGPVCRCGSRGCLEAYASTVAVQELMAGQLPGATFDEIVAAARAGNLSAVRTFEDAGLHLGWGLASIVNLLNPGVVVVGGDMAAAGDLLLEHARSGLRRHALDAVATTPIVVSELGERASLVGAVLLAADRAELLVEG